jgi:DNA-binding transcriptional MocR family regulator
VEVPSKQLVKEVGVHRTTLYKFRDELAQAGYIRFKPGIGKGATEYHLCPLHEAQKAESKPAEAYRSLPKPTKQGTPAQGTFDLDEFLEANLRNTFGDDY